MCSHVLMPPTTPDQVIEALRPSLCWRSLHCRQDGTLAEAEARRIEVEASARLPEGGSVTVSRTHDALHRSDPTQESFTILGRWE